MLNAKVYITTNTPSTDDVIDVAVGTGAIKGTEPTVADENPAPARRNLLESINIPPEAHVGSDILILSFGSTMLTTGFTTSQGVKKLPLLFLVSFANCSKRYSYASPNMSSFSKSEFRSLGELK
jgi:hypothetical protein